jgi:hypothetical protein
MCLSDVSGMHRAGVRTATVTAEVLINLSITGILTSMFNVQKCVDEKGVEVTTKFELTNWDHKVQIRLASIPWILFWLY